ncbi:MAG: hypothetical protein JWQ71_216 [Pedosphaera sp.]|nr:hypothetical protein [Pedosphaera sp.]
MSRMIILLAICANAYLPMTSLAKETNNPPVVKPWTNALPAQVTMALDKGEKFVLYSLESTKLDATGQKSSVTKQFHGFRVLGKTEIKKPDARKELLGALYQGIADSSGAIAKCFNPRHGISVTYSNETVDLLICFECHQIVTFSPHGKMVTTTDSPMKVFNSALKKANLPVSSK